ncbi:MAG TPA: TlpA disulfide reductase family protein [Phycisphaerae bacterium]|nr:TlpA disulfide reductase family protein [Phycisphaerae bacterium]
MGLAFVTGVLVFAAVIQIMRRWEGDRPEPLTPAAERKAGELQAPYFAGGEGEAGRVWRLADQKGKVVVVNLFATWCPPCRQELPELKALAKEYGPRGVEFVALSLDQDGEVGKRTRDEVLAEFLQQEAMPMAVLVPARESILWKTQQLPIPQTFLYDREGRSARVIVGSIVGRGMRASLDELLREQ